MAARLNVLGISQITARLDDALRLLGSAPSRVTAWHRSMGATIAWSYDLLTPLEQMLLARPGVFHGDFDFDAAEAICAQGEITPDHILDLVGSLCNKSLLVLKQADGGARYRLLEPIRQFALKKLQTSSGQHAGSDDEGEWRMRHALYYLRLV